MEDARLVQLIDEDGNQIGLFEIPVYISDEEVQRLREKWHALEHDDSLPNFEDFCKEHGGFTAKRVFVDEIAVSN